MINETNLKFDDISTESWREYVFKNEETVQINEPKFLHVSRSGGHRVLDSNGVSYYISPGWMAIKWKAKEGMANFVK